MTTDEALDLSTHTPVTDERVKKQKPLQRLILRPEVGALIGAIAILIFFIIVAFTAFDSGNFEPLLPMGVSGVTGAAARWQYRLL